MTQPIMPDEKRAEQIANIRAFADFLEASPWAPMPYMHAQTEIALDDIWQYAQRVGSVVIDRLDDRTEVDHRFGEFEYRVIAWHKDGRPAHTGAVTDEGLVDETPALTRSERAKAEILADLRGTLPGEAH